MTTQHPLPHQGWSQDEIRLFLEQQSIPVRLAAITKSGWPLVVSLWYIYMDNKIYCATQKTAKIVAHLAHEPRCAFEIAGDTPPYRGVRGQGHVVLDESRGVEILEILLQRYLKSTTSPLAKRLLANSHTEVAIEIAPVRLSTWDYSTRMKSSLPLAADLPDKPTRV